MGNETGRQTGSKASTVKYKLENTQVDIFEYSMKKEIIKLAGGGSVVQHNSQYSWPQYHLQPLSYTSNFP
jgi:hypothetical protein